MEQEKICAVKIAPSLLTADFARLGEQLREAEAAGADYIHLDVMDGHFVPPITFGSLLVAAARRATSLPLDIHLMVERPERQLQAFAEAGAGILSVHVEACPHVHRTLQQIKELGCRAGVCLNPGTPPSALEEVLEEVEQVMVMGVNPGWGGQELIPSTLDKLRRIRAMLDERGLAADIEVDGGVKVENAASCVEAGARVLVAGSAVFNDRASVAENMRALRESLARAGLAV
ncbi:MAG: ribulose-phosphate 3-epimerase [Dehalococcoidia bacterium]